MNFNYRIISNLSRNERETAQRIKDHVRDFNSHDPPNSLDNLVYLQQFSYKLTFHRIYCEKNLVGIYYDYFIQSLPKHIGERITLNLNLSWSTYDSLNNSIYQWEEYNNIEIQKELYQILYSDFLQPLKQYFLQKKAKILELQSCIVNQNGKKLIKKYEDFKKRGDLQKQNEIIFKLIFNDNGYDKCKFEKIIIRDTILVDPRDVQILQNTKNLKLINVPTHQLVKYEIQKLQNLKKYYHITTKSINQTNFSIDEQKQLLLSKGFEVTNLLKLKNVQSFTLSISTCNDKNIIMDHIQQLDRKIKKIKFIIKYQVDFDQIFEIYQQSKFVSKYVIITTDLQLNFEKNYNNIKINQTYSDFIQSNLQKIFQEHFGQTETKIQIKQNVFSHNKDQPININAIINLDKNQDGFESQTIDIRFQDFMDIKSKLQINIQ